VVGVRRLLGHAWRLLLGLGLVLWSASLVAVGVGGVQVALLLFAAGMFMLLYAGATVLAARLL
jgi:hypothetical protein